MQEIVGCHEELFELLDGVVVFFIKHQAKLFLYVFLPLFIGAGVGVLSDVQISSLNELLLGFPILLALCL